MSIISLLCVVTWCCAMSYKIGRFSSCLSTRACRRRMHPDFCPAAVVHECKVHVDVSSGYLLRKEEWGARLGRTVSSLPAATRGTMFSTSNRLGWAFHALQEQKTWLPPGRCTCGIKAFTNTKQYCFHQGVRASPALGPGSQGCTYLNGRIWRTAALNVSICAGSVVARLHQSGIWLLAVWQSNRVALGTDGLGLPPCSVPLSQHLSSGRHDVNMLSSSTAGSNFMALHSSSYVFLDDILLQMQLQTVSVCVSL